MNLVLLTKFYPFGTGEAFIENEMDVLSRYYDKILVVACEAPRGSKARGVPQNVTVEKIDGVGNFGKMLDTIIGQANHIRPVKEFQEERKACKTVSQRAFLGYFERKSKRIYKSIKGRKLLAGFEKEPFVLYSYWFFATARIATLVQRDYNVAYTFCRAHGYDIYTERHSINYLPYRELFLKSFDYVFPCSEDGVKYLQGRYPAYKEKIKAALLGTIDHGISSKSEDGAFRIVSCSRVVPLKRVERICDALTLLDGKIWNIEWTHIGGGEGLNNLRKKAETGLRNIKCQFLEDVTNAEVMRLYKTKPFDLFVNVSSTEGLPVSIMEAISFGIPVLATNVGGTSEIVQSEITGHLLPADLKNEELAGEIQKFYNLKSEVEEYENCRNRCRSFWEEHFQAVNNYNDLCRLIQCEIGNNASTKEFN